MKDTGLRIIVQCEHRDGFVRGCQVKDKSAARVLRKFTRTYIDEHQKFFADVPPTSFRPKAKGG